MSLKLYYTPIAELTFKDELYLNIKVLEGANMTLQNAMKHYAAIKDVTGGKNYLALIDVSNYFTIESEALHYAALPETIGNRIAAAHYRSSTANSLTTKYFISNYKPSIPIKIFETKAEAIEWLRSVHDGQLISNSSFQKR